MILKKEKTFQKTGHKGIINAMSLLPPPLGGGSEEKIEIVGSEKEISEVSIYHFMIYQWVN